MESKKNTMIAEKFNMMEITLDQIEQLESKGEAYYTGLLYGMPVIIRKLGENTDKLQQLISGFSKYNHPSLTINYAVIIKTESNNGIEIENVYIVRELVKGKDFYCLTTMDNHNRLVILYKIICLLEYLHSFNIFYKFLRPSKIIISKDANVKLLNLIQMDQFKLEHLKTKALLNDEYRFYCPELFKNSSSSEDLNKPYIDIYSVGCLIYYAIFQSMPWKDYQSKEEILSAYLNKKDFIPENDIIDDENSNIYKIIKCCLNGDYTSIGLLREDFEKLPQIALYLENGHVNFDYTKGKYFYYVYIRM